jgi:hypothetical protein
VCAPTESVPSRAQSTETPAAAASSRRRDKTRSAFSLGSSDKRLACIGGVTSAMSGSIKAGSTIRPPASISRARRDGSRFSMRLAGPDSRITPSWTRRAPSSMILSSPRADPRRGPVGPCSVISWRTPRISVQRSRDAVSVVFCDKSDNWSVLSGNSAHNGRAPHGRCGRVSFAEAAVRGRCALLPPLLVPDYFP